MIAIWPPLFLIPLRSGLFKLSLTDFLPSTAGEEGRDRLNRKMGAKGDEKVIMYRETVKRKEEAEMQLINISTRI
jgi:hypothetical protein